jgi:phosphinothricin acetyltransferase
MSVSIRCAAGDDAGSVRGIYEPVVLDTAISFETLVPTVSEMRGRIERTLDRLPWLVCEQEGKVLGYGYAGPHRAREAYQWSVEFSAFVHPTARRRGVGTGLYRSLAAIVRRQGYRNAYAGITLPNDGSLRLHE